MGRRDARRIFHSHPFPANLKAFRALRNEMNQRLEAAKNNYLMQRLNSAISSTQLWAIFRSFGLAKQRIFPLPKAPFNDLNEFFISSYISPFSFPLFPFLSRFL